MMKSMVIMLAASTMLAACGVAEFEANVPMKLSTDLTAETIHSAVCTRGNSPFKLNVTPEGEAVGRIVRSDAALKAGIKPVDFPASFRTISKKTVLLEIPVGPVNDEPVSETLGPVITGGELVMRGDSFDCAEVRVRQYN